MKAVKMMSGESRRMRRDWVTSALSIDCQLAVGYGEDLYLTENDQPSSQGRSGGTATGSLESQEHGGNGQDTADSREQAHCNVWDTGLQVVLADVLEVEVAVESSQPTGQSNEHLRERRVDVHEELALDVFRGESTEARVCVSASLSHVNWSSDILDFIEDNAGGLGYPEQAHDARNNCQETQELPVRARQAEDVMVLHALRLVADECLRLLLLLACIRGGRSCGRTCWRARGGFTRAARLRLLAQVLVRWRAVRHGGGGPSGLCSSRWAGTSAESSRRSGGRTPVSSQ